MPRRDPRAFLSDILDSCERIGRLASGRTLEDYKRDETLRLACERLLGIMGEAVSQLQHHDPAAMARVTESERIVGFRNILIHGYYQLVDDIVWTIIQNDVPRLKREARALLEREEPA